MFKGTQDDGRGRVLAGHRRGGRPRQRVHQQRLHRLLRRAPEVPPRARLEAGGRPHGKPDALARGVGEGDQGGDGGAALPHRRPAALPGLRADDGDGADRASLPQSRHRLDERPAEHDASRTRASSTSAGTRRTTRCWSWSATSSRARCSALAEKHFGGIKARPLPARKPQDEPPQLGVKRVTVKAPAELPYVLMVFRAPPLRDPEQDWEPYALDMLAAALSGNAAARLPRNLVRTERLASSASASYDGLARGPGFFYLAATPTPGKTAAEVEQGLRREMAEDPRGRRDAGGARAREGAGHSGAGLPARFDDGPGARDRRPGDHRHLAQDA